ncbi:unnamed protein product [Mesocestoides corti]|uniref:Uncharacterized protein n=2 Tax=Mesocestoides corti TaxID=53468 RepID=A0A0R3UJ68_MESCO|nr:unnamed protein product [Mesocestoides corti]
MASMADVLPLIEFFELLYWTFDGKCLVSILSLSWTSMRTQASSSTRPTDPNLSSSLPLQFVVFLSLTPPFSSLSSVHVYYLCVFVPNHPHPLSP